MLLSGSLPLSTKLRSALLKRIQSPDAAPPLLFLYPRWFADVSVNANNESQPPLAAPDPAVTTGALDYPPHARDSRAFTARRDAVEADVHSSKIRTVLKQRYDSLPRAKLQARSSLEQGLLDRIYTAPTYTNARKEIEQMFEEFDAEEAARKKAHLARMKETHKPDRIDWLPIATKLTAIASVSADHSTAKTMKLRLDFLKDHAGDAEPNMWVHRIGTGAEVHLTPTAETSRGSKTVILHGSARSVELAEKDLLRLQEKFSLAGTRRPVEGAGLSLGKGTVVSVRTFSAYVSRLVQHTNPRQAQQETGETLNDRKAAALVRVFLDPAASKFISNYALRRALAFVTEHDELEATSDILYDRAKILGLKLDTGCFNHLLRQAIARNKKQKVVSLIADMHTVRASPDGKTWMLFFAAAQSWHTQLTILSMMKEVGVTLRRAEQSLAVQKIVQGRLISMQDSSTGFQELIDDLDKLFGQDWLTPGVYKRMIDTITRRRNTKLKQIPRALLELPQQRGLDSTQRIEHSKLTLHRHQQDVGQSLSSLASMLEVGRRDVPRTAIMYAFMAAWDRRWPNVCRVLWRHAVSHGNISNTMQTVVNRSLLRNTSESSVFDGIWWRIAGCLVAGTDLDTQGFDSTFPRLSQQFKGLSNPMEWLSVYTSDDGTRDEQISLAYLIINRELTAWKRFQPMTNDDLRIMLGQATKKDILWKEDKSMTRLPLSSLLRQAIPVGLKERDLTSEINQTTPLEASSSKRDRTGRLPDNYAQTDHLLETARRNSVERDFSHGPQKLRVTRYTSKK